MHEDSKKCRPPRKFDYRTCKVWKSYIKVCLKGYISPWGVEVGLDGKHSIITAKKGHRAALSEDWRRFKEIFADNSMNKFFSS